MSANHHARLRGASLSTGFFLSLPRLHSIYPLGAKPHASNLLCTSGHKLSDVCALARAGIV